MKPDVIFIGGGPIGLLAAIQLKLECPDKEILIFDKYEEPQRNHAMYVDQSSFKDINRGKDFGTLLDSINTKVIISDMEKKLRAFAIAIALGIKIQYQEINDIQELMRQYPDTRYLIGSGGLKGIVHPQIFQAEDQINESLRYAVEVKYKVKGTTRSLDNKHRGWNNTKRYRPLSI